MITNKIDTSNFHIALVSSIQVVACADCVVMAVGDVTVLVFVAVYTEQQGACYRICTL